MEQKEQKSEPNQTAEEQIENEEHVFSSNNVQLELRAEVDKDDPEVKTRKGKTKNKKKIFGSFGRFHRLEDNEDEMGESKVVPHIMSEQEIMHKYWKLAVSH